MKTLTSSTPAPTGEVNWQAKCNALYAQNLALLQQVDRQNKVRNQEATARNMQSVRDFVEDMSPAQGIVTCANIYNPTWFAEDADTEYAKVLCAYFVERFANVSTLAESTYQFWSKTAPKLSKTA
jgi:hypothetical protein